MAYTFVSGSSQYLHYPNALPNGDINARFVTIACWFKAAALSTGTKQVLVAWTSDFFSNYYHLEIGLQPSSDRAYASWAGATAEATLDLSTDTWYHLTGTFEYAPSTTRTDPACYINGANVGTATGSGAGINGTVGVYIGRSVGVAGYASATIAEVAGWYYGSAGDRNFTDAELAILAAGYSPLLVRPQELVNYLPLVGHLNDTVWGKTFTAYNTPTVSAHPRVLYPARTMLGENTYAVPATGHPAALRDWVRHTGRPWRPQRGL